MLSSAPVISLSASRMVRQLHPHGLAGEYSCSRIYRVLQGQGTVVSRGETSIDDSQHGFRKRCKAEENYENNDRQKESARTRPNNPTHHLRLVGALRAPCSGTPALLMLNRSVGGRERGIKSARRVEFWIPARRMRLDYSVKGRRRGQKSTPDVFCRATLKRLDGQLHIVQFTARIPTSASEYRSNARWSGRSRRSR